MSVLFIALERYRGDCEVTSMISLLICINCTTDHSVSLRFLFKLTAAGFLTLAVFGVRDLVNNEIVFKSQY